MKNIKRFSRARDKMAINRDVEEHFVVGDEFALGLPITVLELISNGISHVTR
jgi:two-component sensor histidine kinase